MLVVRTYPRLLGTCYMNRSTESSADPSSLEPCCADMGCTRWAVQFVNGRLSSCRSQQHHYTALDNTTTPQHRYTALDQDPQHRYTTLDQDPQHRYTALDQDPLLTPQRTRKRRTSANDPCSPVKHKPQRQKQIRPTLKLDIPNTNQCYRSQLELHSPGSVHSNKYIQDWLFKCPPAKEYAAAADVKYQKDPKLQSDKAEKCQKFVMIQIFRKDTLLEDDLIPLYEDDNMEINISYDRHGKGHKDTSNFRCFQISRNDPFNCEEFKKQFGGGIRLFCRKGKEVSLQKSTRLLTYYGSGSSPTSSWKEMTSQEDWEHVFSFDSLAAKNIETDNLGGKSDNLSGKTDNLSREAEYNRTTACLPNVVRISVGCTPNSKQIYETDFHVKLSFVMH